MGQNVLVIGTLSLNQDKQKLMSERGKGVFLSILSVPFFSSPFLSFTPLSRREVALHIQLTDFQGALLAPFSWPQNNVVLPFSWGELHYFVAPTNVPGTLIPTTF